MVKCNLTPFSSISASVVLIVTDSVFSSAAALASFGLYNSLLNKVLIKVDLPKPDSPTTKRFKLKPCLKDLLCHCFVGKLRDLMTLALLVLLLALVEEVVVVLVGCLFGISFSCSRLIFGAYEEVSSSKICSSLSSAEILLISSERLISADSSKAGDSATDSSLAAEEVAVES
ncbi:hypothetical protein WICPIJ_007613 [Wickerhamomyces pijperi]|uniref:Uncharacterized protein n=1 Tax=Wickerhamomyces pijperi TaxID=599730 RepID=A0A9P8TKA8_WICPI|nr:hypothetical protein WICPIJ_007613 [Wickerhamomyces pijperi]